MLIRIIDRITITDISPERLAYVAQQDAVLAFDLALMRMQRERQALLTAQPLRQAA